MTRPAAALALLVLAAGEAHAQPGEPAALRGDAPQTRKRLAEAEQKLLGGKAADAVEDLQRVLDEAGDDLVSVDGKHYRPARWLAHQLLGRLPADALKAYQARIDEPARKLLAAGTRDNDPRPLWLLLDRYFVSRPAADGLLRLGDLLFERGEFRTAELVWRRLLADADPDLAHPTPPPDPAAVRARLVLAAVFADEPDRARADLAAFRARHPTASGPFAGKTGLYADVLEGFLTRPPALAPEGGRGWPTFAGGPGQAGRAPGPIPYHWPQTPTWVAPIPPDPAGRGLARAAPVAAPFGHPVIADGRVYLADGGRVLAFDLHTGKPGAVVTPPRPGFPGAGAAAACATLTAADGRLYARLGPAAIRPPAPGPPGEKAADDTALACYPLAAPGGRFAPPLRERWRVGPPVAEGKGPGVWEGTPLVAGGRMWAALARFEGGRVVHSIAGFDPADPDAAPDRPAWVVEVCDSPLSLGTDGRGRHELLTLAGRNVVFNANAGAVVAVDAATGRRAWGFVYPRAARRAADAARAADPAPAVAAGGRVFVAPADADRVYALDAETGQPLWESGPTDGAQVVGVARNRVVVTTAGPVRGIRGLSVTTGAHRDPGGWLQAAGGGLPGYGRGLVADNAIVWPSRAGLFFLDPDTGRPLADPLRTPPGHLPENLFGNVVYADGVLVVVTSAQVWGYVAESVPKNLPVEAPRPRWEALTDAAERELAGGDNAAARAALVKATAADFPAAWRAWAAARLLLLTPPVADPRDLPRDVRDALDPRFVNEWVVTAAGELLTFGTLLDRRTRRPAPHRAATPPTLPQPRKPDDAPDLAADATVARSARLPPAAFPLRPIDGAGAAKHLFVATPADLIAFPLDPGDPTDRPAADAFTHAADMPGGVVAAGPFAVALYAPGRAPPWVFRAPDTDPLPARPGTRPFRTGGRSPSPHLSSFALSGTLFFARVGDDHLIALDLKTLRVAWVLGVHGRGRFEPLALPTGPRFEPRLFVAGQLLVAQLSDGRRWMVRADTGRVWDGAGATFPGAVPAGFGDATARTPWVAPPAEVEADRLAFSDGPGRVRLVDLTSGRTKWTYDAGGDASLAGDPPQVRVWGDTVVVAVRRNHGVELDRIEPADGTSAWTGGPAFLDATRLDLAACAADPQRVYVPAGDRLVALALDDGKVAWAADLPKSPAGWVVRAGRKAVIAYPAEAIPDEPHGAAWDRLAGSFRRTPLAWRLPGLAAGAYDSWAARTVPVLLFDPETGERLQRLDLPARGPGVAARFEGEVAIVVTGERVAWLK